MQGGLMYGAQPLRGADGFGPLPFSTSPQVWPQGMLNAQRFGMDPNGVSDNAEAFMQAVQASISPIGTSGYNKLSTVNADYFAPSQGMYVPPGTYLFNRSADFSKLIMDSTLINNWKCYVDPGAVFIAGPGLGGSPIINMQPPTGVQFSAGCDVRFGLLVGSGAAGQTGLALSRFSNSLMTVMQIEGVSGVGSVGFFVNQVAATIPSGNSYITLPLLSSNTVGFQTNGSVGAFGFQGNTIYFGDVTFNTGDGIVIDSGGVGLSSTYNRFHLGVSEHNGGFGIRDNAGASQWLINNSNSNTSGGITFASTLGAGRIPYVRGYLTDTTPMVANANKVDIVNFAQDIGVSAPAPAVPATTVAVANTFDTPVDVYTKPAATTTVSAVTVNGVATGLTYGTASAINNIGPIRLLPGETIAMTYATSTITWVWLRSR